jgi:hypothetical protein
LLSLMLTPDPTLRVSATEALRHPWITGPQDDSHLNEAHGKIKETVEDKQRRGSHHKGSGVLGFLFRRQSLLK